MKVLVTGGAGYIGSHTVRQLGESRHQVIVFDNLSTGFKESVLTGELQIGDLSDESLLDDLFQKNNFDAVVHFAGSIVVPESVTNPLMYYENNTVNSFRLIRMCKKHHVKKFIFSSTAAVYGIAEDGKVLETSPKAPINPYGRSKLMTEWGLEDYSHSNPEFNYVALRYFNVAGADFEGRIGQKSKNATHLIKIASEVATGKRDKMKIFGYQYPTPDGTCIRDYIHVEDLASAHVKALEYLHAGGTSNVFNCGYGHGFSVKEVISTFERVLGKKLNVEMDGPRAGDPPILISNNQKIREKLNWEPKFNDLPLILKSAYHWETKI